MDIEGDKVRLAGDMAGLSGAPGYLRDILKGDKASAPAFSPDEWLLFLDMLKPHFIKPLFYMKLDGLPQECRPPASIMALLKESSQIGAGRSLEMESELRAVMKALKKDNVVAAVIKGPALAHTVYPFPSQRPYSDIDLLVEPGRVVDARDALINAGYKCVEKNFDFSPGMHCEEEFAIERRGKVFYLEVHWGFLPYPGKDDNYVRRVLGRARTVNVSGMEILTPDIIDSMVIVALHACLKHYDNVRLIWLFDIALLAGQMPPEDADTLIRRSHDASAGRAMMDALRLSSEWTGAYIPKKLLDPLSWPAPTRREQAMREYFIGQKHNTMDVIPMVLKNIPGNREKMRVLARLALPPETDMRREYPEVAGKSKHYLYMHRFLRLARGR